MKINKIHLLSLSLLLTIFTGCSEDFLEQTPEALMSAKQKKELVEKNNPNVVKGGVFGMYSNLFIGGTGGTEDHDDFGQKSIDIKTDMMSGDMALINSVYGWFRDAEDLTGYLKTSSSTYKVWRYYYSLIKSANDMLDDFNDTIPTDKQLASYVAQAKFVRGYAYYNLLQIYAGNYGEWKDIKVIPYYTTQKTVATTGLSTPNEIMSKTIADLEKALNALTDYTRSLKFEIDANVAKGILAYCKLYVEDYQGAVDLTEDLLSLPLMTKKEIVESGFRTVDTPAWMWGVDITVDNTGMLRSFWGHVDVFTYSYAMAGEMKAIDANLFATISNDDERKQWFLADPNYPYINWLKFYAKDRKVGGDRQWVNDICFMRTAEMFLINAEANARLNNDAKAKTTLQKLLAERNQNANINGFTNAQLLEEIHKNWRFEMWGEGKALSVMKRFKSSITRGNNHYALKGNTIKYDDKRLVYEIPEVEQVNNPNLH